MFFYTEENKRSFATAKSKLLRGEGLQNRGFFALKNICSI
jgi:hypothetical protein